MNKRRIALLAVLVLVVAAVLAAYFVGGKSPEQNALQISGNIEVTDVDVSFKIPGRVTARLISEGESVKAGQIAAYLDNDELLHEAGLRRADLGAASAAFAELDSGSRPEEIAEVRATHAGARAEAQRARMEVERQTGLFHRDVISKRELEVAEASNRIALARAEVGGNRLALVEQGPRTERIDEARQRVKHAEEALALAETRLSYASLTVPLSGMVLADHVEPGELVAAGTPVVTIGNLDSVWLRGYVDETDLGRVKVGQKVRVSTDTYEGKVYEGRISFIASQAEFTPKSVQTQRERVKLVYRIRIDIANPHGELKPGMPADAEIELAGI